MNINEHLLAGGAIAFPTDTVWGLGALPKFADVLFEIKQRPKDKHLIIMSDTLEHLRPWMRDFPPLAFELAEKYWPGALTIIGNDDPTFGAARIPDCKIFRDLCAEIDGHCLATTSANISGQPPLSDANAIRKAFPTVIVTDGEVPKDAPPSTVVRVAGNETEILRRGKCVL
jgi:L-threonylcarbamoyladenylate synthase